VKEDGDAPGGDPGGLGEAEQLLDAGGEDRRLAGLVEELDLAAARHLQPLGSLTADGLELLVGEGSLKDVEQGSAPQLGERLPPRRESGQELPDFLLSEAGQAQLGPPVREAADAGEEGDDLRIVQRQDPPKTVGGGLDENPFRFRGPGDRHLGLGDDEVLVTGPLPGGNPLPLLVERQLDRGV
jgi:hypothetical protein